MKKDSCNKKCGTDRTLVRTSVMSMTSKTSVTAVKHTLISLPTSLIDANKSLVQRKITTMLSVFHNSKSCSDTIHVGDLIIVKVINFYKQVFMVLCPLRKPSTKFFDQVELIDELSWNHFKIVKKIMS
jgi:hypothetical protein